MVARLAPDAAQEECARHVYVLLVALEGDRRAADAAEAAHPAALGVFEVRELVFAAQKTETARPHPDIGRVRCAMRAPGGARMIMPRPARRHADLEGDGAA